MHRKKNPAVILAALALILIGAVLLLLRLTPVGDAVPRNTPAPYTPVPYSEGAAFETQAMRDFVVMGDAGQTSLFELLGKPVLVHFWNGDSEAVVEELQALERAYQHFGEDVQFLVVHTRGSLSEDAARALFLRQAFTLPLYFDADGSARKACGAPQAPATYFIDADGFLAAASETGIDEDALQFGLSLLSTREPLPPASSADPDATAAPEALPPA